MARPIEYDLEKVLDNAMELFWNKGYENVSMADLVSHTGLNSRTMYLLFKDKNGLYKDTLDHYRSKRASYVIKVLKNNAGKKGIEKFLKIFTFGNDFKGCLFTNCMIAKDRMSNATLAIPSLHFSNLQIQIELNLKEASLQGEFTGDIKVMALTIITCIHGLNVHGKYNHSKEEAINIIENILTMIR